MSSRVRLIVGLGNPGGRYDATRHNAGARFVEEASSRVGADLRVEPKFGGRIASAMIGSDAVHLFVPDAYMNVSGLPVAKVARFYKIPVDEILVVHDELELPPGEVRCKSGGGHGGHNGLRDLVKHLGGNGFGRLRIGIGRPAQARDVSNYVLKKATSTEAMLIDAAVDKTLNDLPAIVAGSSNS